MSKFDMESLGYAGAVILHDGDTVDNIKGLAIQAIEDTTFTTLTFDTTEIKTVIKGKTGSADDVTIQTLNPDGTPVESYTPSGGTANTTNTVVDGDLTNMAGATLKAGSVIYLPFTKVVVNAGLVVCYRRV